MHRIKTSATLANHTKRASRLFQQMKFDGNGRLDVREEQWWSRRLASGSDWMDAWISKPGKR